MDKTTKSFFHWKGGLAWIHTLKCQASYNHYVSEGILKIKHLNLSNILPSIFWDVSCYVTPEYNTLILRLLLQLLNDIRYGSTWLSVVYSRPMGYSLCSPVTTNCDRTVSLTVSQCHTCVTVCQLSVESTSQPKTTTECFRVMLWCLITKLVMDTSITCIFGPAPLFLPMQRRQQLQYILYIYNRTWGCIL